MQKLKLKMISAAVAMTLVSTMSYGAGLGKLKVSSGLGEPLIAEIELLSVTADEMDGLTAEIASIAAYEAQGIERTSAASNVRVQTSKRADGTPILKLTSSQPVTDPFLDMLVQVDWASGRILREYTILLDPPSEVTAAPKPRIALPELNSNSFDNNSVAVQSGNTATVVTPAPEKKSSKRSKKVKTDEEKLAAAKAEAMAAEKQAEKPAEQVAKTSNTDNAAGTELTSQRGDTLGKIARENMPQGVNLDQMLIALYKANKSAFAGDNINRLKVGQIIRVPSVAEIEAISKQEAKAEVVAQTQDWNAYRNSLAGVVAEAPATADSSDNQAGTGKITTTVDQSAKPVEPTQDVVKLSKNDTSSKNAKTTATQASDAKAENKTAATNAAKEADIKAQMLDKNVKDMKALKELTELKNKTLADAQNAAKLAEAQKIAEATAATKSNAETKTDEPKVDATVAVAETASAEAPVVTAEVTKPAEPAVAEVKPKAVAPIMVEPVAAPSMIDTVMSPENLPLVGGGLGLLALVGGGWLFMRNRRKKNITGFEHSIMTGGGLRGNTVFGNTGGATVDTGDTSFLTDFTNNPGGIIDTNEVDPIAEAEVYMAYGRENQAEEILKDAIIKEPVRYELHLKLLEILAGRNDSSAFEAIAGELYSALGTDDPVWKKVAEMGEAMEPNNPLYKTSTPIIDTATQFNSTSKNLIASDFDQTQLLTGNSLDFSLDDELQSDVTSVADNSLDFEFGDNEESSIEDTAADGLADFGDNAISFEVPEKSDLDLSFDMPSMDLPAENDNVVEFESAPTLSLPDNLDMGAFGDTDLSFASAEEDKPVNESPELALGTSFENVDSAIDFTFDETQKFDDVAEIAEEADLPISNLSSGFGDISFDLDEQPAQALSEVMAEAPEIDTKLDLIAAYIEMDDKEGAKELLEEVLKEGGESQRAKAKALLASID